MPEDDYFLPVTEVAKREEAAEAEQQAASALAIAAIADPRERAMVTAVDRALSLSLGSADGYIPSLGEPLTRQLQASLAAYGVTPDYGASIGMGHRVSRYP